FGGFKGGLFGSVRMETPVLYFYGSRESSANVKILFPKGTITEWYPQESGMRSNGSIEWRDIRVSPDAAPDFPAERGTSHYYAARQTDAAPLQVGSQKEKFLFYRGVGTFPIPISARLTDASKILAKTLGPARADGLLLFENRGGCQRYRLMGGVQAEIVPESAPHQCHW